MEAKISLKFIQNCKALVVAHEDVMDNIEKYPGVQNTVMPEIVVH